MLPNLCGILDSFFSRNRKEKAEKEEDAKEEEVEGDEKIQNEE